jgi:hypothetical protein
LKTPRLVTAAAMLAVSFSLLTPRVAHAEDFVSFFEPCKTSTESECIESVVAVSDGGERVVGVPTGRYVSGPLSWNDAYLSHIDGDRVEWNFAGLKFSNGSGKALIASWYWPENALHCWNNGSCLRNEEEVDLYMRPSDLDHARPSVVLNNEDGLIVCPKNPTNCNIGSPPWEFGDGVKFEFSFRAPKGFSPAYTQGRTKDLQVLKTRTTKSFNVYRVNFAPLTLDNVYFGLADMFAIKHGLYRTDEPAIWLYGQNNNHANPLGSCVSIGGLSVVSNAFTMSAPTWNSRSKSIEVQLAATHVRTDGKLNEGYLEVRVPLKMAECMWGIELRDKVQAKFALTYDDGAPDEILTVVGGIHQSDYVLISAGFHYSSPRVSIKLDSTPLAESVLLEAQTQQVQSKTKLSTITCVNQKNKVLTKKITAVGPKCPTGYKKK